MMPKLHKHSLPNRSLDRSPHTRNVVGPFCYHIYGVELPRIFAIKGRLKRKEAEPCCRGPASPLCGDRKQHHGAGEECLAAMNARNLLV